MISSISSISSISIAGLGLLGSSLASLLKSRMPEARITGISSRSTIRKALDCGIIDQGGEYAEINSLVKDSKLIILCTPITQILEQLQAWKLAPPEFRENCIITDVGSTKNEICQAALETFAGSPRVTFIGSHPMAGSEKNGFEARDKHLFENASWIICPLPGTPPIVLEQFASFIEITGARCAQMSADLHDHVVAHISHLPQVLSSALAAYVSSRENILDHALAVAGGGFRDMTRLADSAWPVWAPIFNTNRSEVSDALIGFLEYLEKVKAGFPENGFEPCFKQGKSLREKLNLRNRGFSAHLWEIFLTIPDRPGVLAGALSVLAENNLNVLDLEILKVREGESGTVRICFKKQEEALAAAGFLQARSFDAIVR